MMYEDGGCIDDFGGVPRHFTPPGAGGWDRNGPWSPDLSLIEPRPMGGAVCEPGSPGDL